MPRIPAAALGIVLSVAAPSHRAMSTSFQDGYRFGRSSAGVEGCSNAIMAAHHERSDNHSEWLRGCRLGVAQANSAAMAPGTSTSAPCESVLYSHPAPGSGRLASVTLQITPSAMVVTFDAKRPWNVAVVAKDDGAMQWGFTEWVPHHRPIFEDNHGGTTFPARALSPTSTNKPSSDVYFTHANQYVFGSYRYTATRLTITYAVIALRSLGVKTPFTWVGSEGLVRCRAVTAR